jgi:hypothetical protein
MQIKDDLGQRLTRNMDMNNITMADAGTQTECTTIQQQSSSGGGAGNSVLTANRMVGENAGNGDMGEIALNTRLAAAEKKNGELDARCYTMQRELEEAQDARRASKKIYDGQVEYNNKLLSYLSTKTTALDEKTKELEGLKAMYKSQVSIKNAQEDELSDVKEKYKELLERYNKMKNDGGMVSKEELNKAKNELEQLKFARLKN